MADCVCVCVYVCYYSTTLEFNELLALSPILSLFLYVNADCMARCLICIPVEMGLNQTFNLNDRGCPNTFVYIVSSAEVYSL